MFLAQVYWGGEFRRENVGIQGSSHIPPDFAIIQDHIDDFLNFINQPPDPKTDLLRVAIAHHGFAWIHPFTNGNGRVVRLLTYAMLIARGFNVRTGRILNPSAVFCSDRDLYYKMLASADEGTDEDLLQWCEYVLNGLLVELKKIDKLLDYDFLKTRILKPAVQTCLSNRDISTLEAKILNVAIDREQFRVLDIRFLTPKVAPVQRSQILARMRKRRLIKPSDKGKRQYAILLQTVFLHEGLLKLWSQRSLLPQIKFLKMSHYRIFKSIDTIHSMVRECRVFNETFMGYSESDTRAKLIDPAIHGCGWTEDLIRREETAGAIEIIDGKPRKRAKGRVDYCLRIKVNAETQPVAVALIEAKAEDLPPTHGLEQVKAYAASKRLNVPFVFSSNGHLFVEYDRFTGITTRPAIQCH